MGQRHQVYLVARVTPKPGETATAYRCVAAVHHQWCYRTAPLRGVHKFERLVKQAEASLLIREELRKYPQRSGINPEHPCPYAEWVLQNAFSSIDIDDGESRHVDCASILKVGEPVETIWNDDGITIVDITDPQRMTIGFMFLGSTKIISPYEYMRAYSCPNEIDEDDVNDDWEPLFSDPDRELISKLDHMPLITMGPIVEAWPDEFQVEDVARPNGSVNLAATPSSSGPSKLPSLVDIALEAALNQFVKDEEGLEHLEHIANLPGATATILTRLKDKPSFSASSLTFLRNLLKKAADYPKKVNLSGYQLTGEQIGEVLSSAQEVEELDISFNADLTSLLSQTPSILPHIESLLHPILIDTEHPFDASLTVHVGEAASTVPLLSSDAGVQMIWNFLQLNTKPDKYPRSMNRFNHLEAAFSMVIASFRRQDVAWDDRFVSLLPKPGYVAGNKKKSFIFYLRPPSMASRIQETKPPFSYGFLAPARQSEVEGSGKYIEVLSLEHFFDRLGSFAYKSPSRSVIPGDMVEILSFSAFLERLQEEGFAPPSDTARLEALAEAFEKMDLVSVEDCYKEDIY
ncbi:hypothetical protein BKA70DRAFT_1301980 [Coprinopsis sp. MPI-PUGE-AT-0042]|nr:hypothetical protein BKA70DRAFT_1301980 [Coprinopsis sp. MPI-PUGE-AT-0042]